MTPLRPRALAALALIATITAAACREVSRLPAATSSGASPAASSAAAPPAITLASVELRTYVVPPPLADEVRRVVDRLLHWGEGQPRLGRVELGPGGELLVSATPAVHAGVEQLLTRLAQEPPAEPSSVELTCWLVEARPAEYPDVPIALAPLRPALDAIGGAEGPRRFTLVESVRLRTVAGEGGRVEGRTLQVAQTATVRGREVVAHLDLRHPGGGIETRIALPVDAVSLIGQAGVEGASAGELYYLVRARVLGPPSR